MLRSTCCYVVRVETCISIDVDNKIFENDDLWCAEQVWDEFLHVGGGLATSEAPRVLQRVEGSIGKVEVAVLIRDSAIQQTFYQ